METQLQGFCVPLGQLIMGCRAQLKRFCTHKHILIKCRSLYRGQAARWHFDCALCACLRVCLAEDFEFVYLCYILKLNIVIHDI